MFFSDHSYQSAIEIELDTRRTMFADAFAPEPPTANTAVRTHRPENRSRRYFMKMFLKTRLSSASAVLAFLLLLPVMGNAQTINGSISGAVTDQNGSAISGASVKVTKVGTGATREATTNSEGIYRIVGLPVGIYAVRVEQSGFQPQVNERVDVSVAIDATANFTLSTASVQEVVVVTETAGLLE